MKRLFLILTIIMLISFPVFAGEIATLPTAINLNTPTTNQVELLTQTYYYGASPYLIIKYNVVDGNGSVVATHEIMVEEADFTTFVNGFGSTMKTRGNVAIWADIQDKYTLVE